MYEFEDVSDVVKGIMIHTLGYADDAALIDEMTALQVSYVQLPGSMPSHRDPSKVQTCR